nr:hypothetical protein [Tanacetum cinerariifolium]
GIFCKRCTCKSCGKDVHIGYNCPSKVPVISIPEPCNNQTIDELPQALPNFHPTFHSEAESPFTLDSTPTYVDESPNCQPMNHDYYHGQNFCYDSNSIGFDQCQTPQYTVSYPIFNAHNDLLISQTMLNEQMTQLTSMCEIFCQSVQKKQEEKRIEEEQAAKAQSWKFPVCYDDDDDEESSNPLEDNIISELPPYSAVTPTEPIDSLSMGDEHLDTIPATESDEVIKSCVENLVPNPKSLPNHDSSIIISSKVGSLFDEFAGELTLLKSFPPGIDKTDCHPEKEIRLTKRLLYDNSSPRPPEEIVSDISNEKSPDLLSHLGFEAFQPSAECPMMINGKNTPLLDVPLFHFYPLDQFKYGGN